MDPIEGHFDFAVIGAGLSGLTTAVTISHENTSASIIILERSSRIGGRIFGTGDMDKSRESSISKEDVGIDLGGTWLWPTSMPFTMELIRRYEIPLVPQAGSDGEQKRVDGGMTLLVQKLMQDAGLSKRIRPSQETEGKDKHPDRYQRIKLILNSVVSKVVESSKDGCVHLTVSAGNDNPLCSTRFEESLLRARHVVIAVPPAKIVEDISFEGEEVRYINESLKNDMRRQPIWMASVGKLSLSYNEKFWDPSDIMMGMRPLNLNDGTINPIFVGAFQIYDAGLDANGNHNIVAFVTCGKGNDNPYNAEEMAQIVTGQLNNIYVKRTKPSSFSQYKYVNFKCWKTDKHINVLSDAEPYPIHPQPITGINDDVEKRRVWFGGSEASQHWTGMIEGAVMNGTQIGKKIANIPEAQ